MRRRALALLIVVGLLGVMSVLAVCFLTLARLERSASQRRIHQTQALLLARSGIEDALARLNAGQDATDLANAYRGEDWDGNGQLSVFEADQEVFRRTGAGTTPDTATCPIAQALRPSFFVKVPGSDNPDTRSVDGRQRGSSGLLSAAGILTYGLKVEDESGKINVNGGFLDSGDRDNNGAGDGIPDHRDLDVRLTTAASDSGLGWNFQLCRILNVLGAEPELGLPNLGTDTLNLRPLGGYDSIAQLQSLIGTTTDLTPYLTTRSWIDRRVVQPNGCFIPLQNAMNEIKKQRAPLALDPAGRPPVNLNTAPRAVLRALMRGLTGYFYYHYYMNPNVLTLTPVNGTPVPAVVNVFVDQILIRRAANPFRDWADFSAFCDTLPPLVGPIPGLPAFYASRAICLPDLIKANFDPNTSLNKDLPDQLKFRFMDKSDLQAWSTEGCFEPTGVFRVTGLGRIRGGDGKLLAEHSLGMTVRLYELLRQTTQKDFLAGRRLEECHSLSSMGAVLRTTGAAASWKSWAVPAGLATLSYPNPPTVPTTQAVDFDGYLGLATVEAMPGEVPAGGTLRFMHHLDDSWTADSGVAPDRVTPGPSDSKLTSPLTDSVWPLSGEPNTLRPDGLHVQSDRCPAFLASNMPTPTVSGTNAYNRGVVGIWVKPTLTPGVNSYDFSIVKGDIVTGLNATQVLLIGRNGFEWGGVLENRKDSASGDPERQVRLTSPLISMRRPMLRWSLETYFFDTDESLSGQDIKFDLRSFGAVVTRDRSGYATTFVVTSSSDLYAYGRTTATSGMMVLGAPDATQIEGNSQAHSVIDEVCVCDFGDTALNAASSMGIWASTRFNDGRYYKENDARFLSTSLSPGVGAKRLLWARWTAYLPKEIRKEMDIGTGLAVDRLLDARLSNSAVELELLDSAGSFTSAPLQALTQGGPIGRTLDAFRYRVTFKPNLPSLSDPVLESPFLDDVTFAWQPASGPRVLAWGAR